MARPSFQTVLKLLMGSSGTLLCTQPSKACFGVTSPLSLPIIGKDMSYFKMRVHINPRISLRLPFNISEASVCRNENSIQFQFNSIQFNSIYFPSKQQTHLKNTQDGGDATKSKSLKDVAPPLQLKNNNKKANIKQRQALITIYRLNREWI